MDESNEEAPIEVKVDQKVQKERLFNGVMISSGSIDESRIGISGSMEQSKTGGMNMDESNEEAPIEVKVDGACAVEDMDCDGSKTNAHDEENDVNNDVGSVSFEKFDDEFDSADEVVIYVGCSEKEMDNEEQPIIYDNDSETDDGCEEFDDEFDSADEVVTYVGCSEKEMDDEEQPIIYDNDSETDDDVSANDDDVAFSELSNEESSVEVIDLTGDDENDSLHSSAICVHPSTICVKKNKQYVWGEEADADDVVQIEKMLKEGTGVYGSPNCKLEIRESVLDRAGRGVFIKEDNTIYHGECITEYCGKHIRSAVRRSVDEQLRVMQVGSVMILGATDLQNGDGFGSLINSSVNGRTLSFCRFVTYDTRIFVMAHVMKSQYPLRGRIELYVTAGHAWWMAYNDAHK